jgi:hypothetical protein
MKGCVFLYLNSPLSGIFNVVSKIYKHVSHKRTIHKYKR